MFIEDELPREDWIRWWLSFSRFMPTGNRGISLNSIKIKDYNYLRNGVNLNLLHITSVEWTGIEVSQLFMFWKNVFFY